MTRYLIRQILSSFVKLFIFITFMFFFIQKMMPGDFVDQFSLGCDTACRAEMRADLGLDLPIWERYFHWLNNILRLDMGNSLYGPPVIDVLKDLIPPTLLIFVIGTAIAFLIGLWLGKRTAWRGSGFISRITTLVGITLFTSFPPWLTWLVTYFLARKVGFVIMGERGGLRAPRFHGLDEEIWSAVELTPSAVTLRIVETILVSVVFIILLNILFDRKIKHRLPGIINMVIICGGTVGLWYLLELNEPIIDILKISWLPILTYILLSFGETMIIMQSSMTEVLKEQYIITAHAKGLPSPVLREKHAARNALLPVLSRLVISLPYLLTGIVIIESSVGWPGMGTGMWNALYWQNMPIVMNVLLIVGVVSLVARLLIDIITAYLDPRIRYDQPQTVAV